MSKPNVLLIDIETSLMTVKTFGLFQQNIGINQIVEPSRVLCFAYRWEGSKKNHFYSEWTHTRAEMLQAAWDALDKADAVVTYNGVSFDCKHLNREFVMAGMMEPSGYVDIDLLKTTRKKFKFASNKLDFICQQLGVGKKAGHTGMQLWMDVDDGCEKAQRTMRVYNIQDVRIMEDLYNKIRGWVVSTFNHVLYTDDKSEPTCPNCGSHELKKNGKQLARTRVNEYQRWRCSDCGKESRSRLAIKQDRTGVLV